MSKRHYYYVVGQSDQQTAHWLTFWKDCPGVNLQDINGLIDAILQQAKKFNPRITSAYLANIVYLGEMTEEEWHNDPANQG